MAGEFLDGGLDGGIVFLADAELGQVEGRHKVVLEGTLVEGTEDHADSGGVVGDGVDEDEGTGLTVLGVGVEEEGLGGEDINLTDFIELERRPTPDPSR